VLGLTPTTQLDLLLPRVGFGFVAQKRPLYRMFTVQVGRGGATYYDFTQYVQSAAYPNPLKAADSCATIGLEIS
jgi:hypothetical protein